MKQCSNCKILKNYYEFQKRKSQKDGYHNQCKKCVNTKRVNSQAYKNELIKMSLYVKNNKDKLNKYRQDNGYTKSSGYKEDTYNSIKNTDNYKQKKKDNYKKWSCNNQATKNALHKKYTTSKIYRTPSWLDKEDFEIIQWAYETAKERELKYNVKFHVDHIIPLQGKNVSGFHCPENLQVIPAYDNLSKSNKF